MPQTDAATATPHATSHGPKQVTIHIDHEQFKVNADSLTGQQLRALPDPDIGPDRDLYLEVPGPGEDELINADQRVPLKDGMHFFTAPAAITPGRAA
jgi:hypothetical protein